jgi:uncharacterized membrane protein YuzA (DUF378 family)
MKSRRIDAIASTLIIIAAIGAINWGLIAFFKFNLVAAVFSGADAARVVTSGFSRVLYAIIGLSGLGALLLVGRRRP